MKRFLFVTFIAILPILLIFGSLDTKGYSSGYENGQCSPCHGTEDESITIKLNGFPQNYTPGESYQVSVSVSGGGLASNKGGIWIHVSHGSLATDDSNLQFIDQGDPKELMHSNDASDSWNFNWTAPNEPVWVTFQIAALLGDDNGSASGDFWNSVDLQINAAGSTNTSAPPPPPPEPSPNYEDDVVLVTILSTFLLLGLVGFLILADR
ncbi:MAG: choice-of-anchor V domain-containing protein, partial [Candidatus Hodarchaeota archaeon]